MYERLSTLPPLPSQGFDGNRNTLSCCASEITLQRGTDVSYSEFAICNVVNHDHSHW